MCQIKQLLDDFALFPVSPSFRCYRTKVVPSPFQVKRLKVLFVVVVVRRKRVSSWGSSVRLDLAYKFCRLLFCCFVFLHYFVGVVMPLECAQRKRVNREKQKRVLRLSCWRILSFGFHLHLATEFRPLFCQATIGN